MTHNYPNTPTNGQGLSYPEQNFSESESLDFLQGVVEESEAVRIYQQPANLHMEWTNSFSDVVRLIRASVEQEDILEIATEEIRQVIRCDRVLVYGLNLESEGVVIAESVAPGFTKALGLIIEDPCFAARYIEQYQNGRVKATNNIYEANLTPCYIEQLEKLEVKGHLVAPILNQGKLFGLLVAHQCSQPRHWQEDEIRWFSLIAMQVGFALDNAKVLAETENFRREVDMVAQWAQYFSDIVKLIRQPLKQQDILEITVGEVQRIMACDRVVVYGLNSDSLGGIIAESVVPGFTQSLGMIIEDPCFVARYIEKYQNGRVRATDNIYKTNFTPCYIEELEKLEVKANLVAPILNQGKLFGLLVAHQCSRPRHWQEHEIRWFSQVSMQLGFALDNAKVLAEAENLRQEVDMAAQWAQYFSDTVKLIRQPLNQKDILEITVGEVQRIMACDRVVVYGLNSDSLGGIIAESVVPGFTQSLGMIIEDPCFVARYIEKYQNGRVRATDDIYKTNFTPCYIEELEKLEVKANLVAPILNQGKLFGLLVAHQCSQPRHWQEYEISWFSQIAVHVGFALDQAKIIEQNIQECELNRTVSLSQRIFLSQQEELRQVVVELIQDNQSLFTTLSTQGQNLSSTLVTSLKRIQKVFDTAKYLKNTTEQVEKQLQLNSRLLGEGRKNLKSTLESMSVYQETSAIASVDDIIENGNQHQSAWTQSLQTTEEKLDSAIAANMEMAKLVDNMAQIVTNQAEISNEAGQYVVAASKIVHKILEQSQTLGKWFTRLLTFCQENMQKIMFWENIKGFLRSSRTLVTFFASKD